MTARIATALMVLAAAATGQPSVGAPRLGCFVDPEGRLRPVYCISGTFTIGDAETEGVISAECSGERTAIKRAHHLTLVSAVRVRGGAALFAFPADGSAPIAYLTESGDLFRGGRPAKAPAFNGEVLTLASPRVFEINAIVRREDGLHLVKARGSIIESEWDLPGVTAPVLLWPDGMLVFADGAELVIRQADSTERRVALPAAPAGLERLGDGWVRIVLPDRGEHLAIAVSANRADLYWLPEALP